MHRLLVETAELKCDSPTLSKDAANHLKVLRPKDGEEIELFDGCGNSRTCIVKRASCIELKPISPTKHEARSTRHSLTLFACVTKGSRWDWTIEKATELGVTRIVPVISERTIVRIDPKDRAAKCERWRKIAEEAARQSDAKWIPEISEPVSFAESLSLVKATTCFVGALTTPPPRTIGAVLSEEMGKVRAREYPPSVASREASSTRGALYSAEAPEEELFPSRSVYVGPEGDFTPAELAALLEIATPVSFGSTILRAETAAIYGLSVLKSFNDARSTPDDAL